MTIDAKHRSPEQRQALEDIARRYHLSLILLFGSHATGRTTPESDVDIAVQTECPEKMADLDYYLDLATELSSEEYERNAPTRRAIERLLQIIIETACDINAHFVAKLAKKAPATRRASFYEMAALGILDTETAEQLARSVGLRNRLVHDYDVADKRRPLDNRLVYAAIREALEQYTAYGRIIYPYCRG